MKFFNERCWSCQDNRFAMQSRWKEKLHPQKHFFVLFKIPPESKSKAIKHKKLLSFGIEEELAAIM